MKDEMTKKPYTMPKLIRVKLTHEQAVLSQCSVTAGSLSNLLGNNCWPSGCRRFDRGGGRDDRVTS